MPEYEIICVHGYLESVTERKTSCSSYEEAYKIFSGLKQEVVKWVTPYLEKDGSCIDVFDDETPERVKTKNNLSYEAFVYPLGRDERVYLAEKQEELDVNND